MTTLLVGEAKRSLNSGLRLCHPDRDAIQAVAFGTRLDQQLIPVVCWMATFQHLAEYSVGVIAAFVRALGEPSRKISLIPTCHNCRTKTAAFCTSWNRQAVSQFTYRAG